MPQFDVHRNLGRIRATTPYLLVIQRDRYDKTSHRVTVPLVLRSETRNPDRDLNPVFEIESQQVVMDPLQIITIPAKALGPAIDNLDRHSTQIIRAIDELIAYGK